MTTATATKTAPAKTAAPAKKGSGLTVGFPAVRGMQGKRQFFNASVPMKLVERLLSLTDESVPVENRVQRAINPKRVPQVRDYILNNREEYVMPALTVAVNGEMYFEQASKEFPEIGKLNVDLDAVALVIDGQHRRAGVVEAIMANKEVGEDHLPIVFFRAERLQRMQQMFSDINANAQKPTASINLLYDHREETNEVARKMAGTVLEGMVDLERATVGVSSHQVFPLKAVAECCKHVWNVYRSSLTGQEVVDATTLDRRYAMTEGVFDAMKTCVGGPWFYGMTKVCEDRKVTPSQYRKTYVTPHAVMLLAVCHVFTEALVDHIGTLSKAQQEKLFSGTAIRDWLVKRMKKQCEAIDWSRDNKKAWDGRCIVMGKMTKTNLSIRLTAISLKRRLGVEITTEEQTWEINAMDEYTRSRKVAEYEEKLRKEGDAAKK